MMKFSIIPEPYRLESRKGEFFFDYDTEIVLACHCTEKEFRYAHLLADTVKDCTGMSLVIRKGAPSGTNEIYFDLQSATEEMPENVRILLNQEQGNGDWICPDAEMEKQWRIRTESYRLRITKEQVCVEAFYSKGILYGIQTLRQLISQCVMVLPCMEIEDHPALANRGFYHDAARGRVRKLSEYKRLADKLSYYKMNQLQLYVEHSYLFRDMTELWRDDTPLTAEEIMELDAYCKTIGVELVPSLASFGHLDKLLKTKSYAHLCELEDSDKERFTFVGRMAHHTINPADEESWEIIKKMLQEFIPLFSSRQFNLCGDETFDLGKGRSKALSEEIGLQQMYVNFVKKICGCIVENGRRPMFWGDVIAVSPELLQELPKSIICLTWGYGENEPEDSAKTMNRVGTVQYLCPGVHGWRHLMNRLTTAYANISRMCSYAKKYDALGFLNTDWGDYGHICNPDFSVPGMIYGAQGSWSGELPSEEEINRRISRVEYGDNTENVVKILSELSCQEEAGWGFLVDYMESLTEQEMSLEEQRNFYGRISAEQLAMKNVRIAELLSELATGAGNLNAGGRKVLPAYFLHARGQMLFNSIAGTIASMVLGLPVSKVVKDSVAAYPVLAAVEQPKQLAADLERWFYDYKNLWRQSCKESELYHIQELLFQYADLLRSLA